jgi:hypothetical protein
VYFCTDLATKSFESLGIELSSISTVIAFGTLKRQMMFCQKHCIVAEVIVAKGFASIHLEKYSTATTTYFKLPYASGSGPNRSKPHLCTGQVGCIS